jgi:hypothetical protein
MVASAVLLKNSTRKRWNRPLAGRDRPYRVKIVASGQKGNRMAQKVQVVLVDDVDGGPADETLKFAVENTQYEIDLSTAHAAEMRAALAPWMSAARKVSGRSTAKARTGADTSKVRAWAKANGYDVSERGRISATVRSAYDAVH